LQSVRNGQEIFLIVFIVDKEEKMKLKKEMKSKDANSNTMYQILAMDKATRKRLRAKLEEQLPVNSRFLNI